MFRQTILCCSYFLHIINNVSYRRYILKLSSCHRSHYPLLMSCSRQGVCMAVGGSLEDGFCPLMGRGWEALSPLQVAIRTLLLEGDAVGPCSYAPDAARSERTSPALNCSETWMSSLDPFHRANPFWGLHPLRCPEGALLPCTHWMVCLKFRC